MLATIDTARVLDAPARAALGRIVLARDDASVRVPEPDGRHRPARARTDTRFRTGNRAWTARRSPGRRRRFADDRALWDACAAYFDWAEATPLIHLEPVVWRGAVTMMVPVPRLRAFTLAGLCAHLGIGAQTWRDYRRRPAFSCVIEAAENTIRVQQFEGAAAGLLDARIVAHWLGRRGATWRGRR